MNRFLSRIALRSGKPRRCFPSALRFTVHSVMNRRYVTRWRRGRPILQRRSMKPPNLRCLELEVWNHRARRQPPQWPPLVALRSFLTSLEFEPSEGDLRVTRDLGGGRLEHLCLPFPIVLTMSDQAVTPLYVSQFRQLRVTTRVAQASQERDEPRTNPPTSDWQPLRPRTHTNDLARKTSGDAHLRMFETFGLSDPAEHTRDECIISDDPENCAAHLIRYLAHHEFIDSACAPDVSVTEKVDLNLSKMPPTTQTQRPSQPTSPKLARGPRPLGYDSPANLRGPFSVRSDRR